MSLPTETDLATLDYVFDGRPLGTFAPNGATTLGLDFIFNGQPMVVQATGGGGGGGSTVQGGFFVFFP